MLPANRVALLKAFLLAPVLALVFSWPALAPTDPDYWWHVRTGELIALTGSVPHVDVFSFTAVGQTWIAHEWLTELTFFVLQQQFGYAANVLLIGLLGCLAALAMYATCRQWGVGELPAVFLVLWAFGMSLGSFGVRPQALTRVLLAASALLLTLYHVRRDARLLLPLPPLFALWSNLHGGFAIGLGLLALTVVGEAVAAFRTRTPTRVGPLALIALLSAVATLLNPNGVAGVVYPLAYTQQGIAGLPLIAEWQPPAVWDPGYSPFWLSLLLAMGLGLARRPLGAAQVLWALAFGVLAVQSVRHIQLWATVVVPLIGARMQAEVPRFRATIAEWRYPWRMALMWGAVSVVCAGVWTLRFTQSVDWTLQWNREPSAAAYPSGGVAYLREHGLRENLFNQFEWGGYLIYNTYPDQHVFVDGRPDMYGKAVLDDYLTVERAKPEWQQVLDAHDVRLLLIDRDGPLAAEVGRDPQWRELYVGRVERLFARAP